ncbi:MAG: very short patch repair endonuclease [Candidatus Coatesbacteria bacterium]|nr:very short patch repair endonuclease [Candidatus Coatesbacteria bacterium]
MRRIYKAGHRSWSAKNAKLPGKNTGDIMSPDKRSNVMSKIKCKNTNPERIIFSLLEEKNLIFQKHYKYLPGKPDIVFTEIKFAVFIDGDFWHGWRFPLWEHKLTEIWRLKIKTNRIRDMKNHSQLRKSGWKVLRIWEHQIEQSPDKCLVKIMKILDYMNSAIKHRNK